MACSYGLGWFILLIAAVNIEAQKKPPTNIRSKCLGNTLRVDVGPLGGKLLEVSVVINNSSILLTPSLASQCGFSMKTGQQGNAVIYVSLQNCFVHNVDDAFTTTLNLRLKGNRMAEDELHQVAETCRHAAWSSREIVCERNYMEVSVKRAAPNDYAVPAHPLLGVNPKLDPRRGAEKKPMDAGFRITSVVFFTPEEKVMTVAEAQRSGYGMASTPSRLVLRGPHTASETYTQNVAGVPMTVLQTSTIFEKKWLATQINAAAACPTVEGSVHFTPNTITWFLPRHIDPLVTAGQFKLVEVHVGVDGERLDATEMAARRYSLSVNNIYIVLEIPVGATGGYFKSHIQDNQYLTSYMIEPMLELLWTEETTHEDTSYKVLFPIATPVLPRPAQVIDKTVPEERIFKMLIGPFGSDVALVNVTFPSEVLSVTDCSARGFNVLEHTAPNSSLKVFTLDVPFTDPVVQQTSREKGTAVFSLQMTLGLLVLPEFAPFSHTANLEATLVDIVAPSVSGGCDHENFYVLVQYGTEGINFQTIVGKQMLTPSLAHLYGFKENDTHFSLVVPFSAADAVFEAVESSSIKSRVDMTLKDPENNRNIQEFSLSCKFPLTLTECFPNGTITVLAVKLESVPSLKPSELTLSDPSCGPVYSDDRHAFFVFTGNSCGTTRKFSSNVMLYENEISLPDELQPSQESETEEPEYELKISCYYDINTTRAVAFQPRPRRSEPFAENAKGELEVVMRIASDESYSSFHRSEDYPIAKYLQQPLYFEIELMRSTNPQVSLELENCWATLKDDRTSKPRWNLIIDGCANPVDPYQVVFHPVWAEARVPYPSHVKRFEVQMFAFAEDQDNLSRQLFVHCDVAICDDRNGGVCNGKCSNQQNRIKGQRRAVSDAHSYKHVSSGPIKITQS